jgi:hypothetical protein
VHFWPVLLLLLAQFFNTDAFVIHGSNLFAGEGLASCLTLRFGVVIEYYLASKVISNYYLAGKIKGVLCPPRFLPCG